MKIDSRFLCSILRSSPTPYGAVDLVNKEIIFSSGLAEKLLGYSKDELSRFAENDFRDIVHPEDSEKNKESLELLRNSKDGEIISSLLRIRSSDGKYYHFQIYDMVYERDNSGKPVKFSSVIQDVTKEAFLKEKLAEALKNIESIRFKNSHEVRAPVSTIMGIVGLMKEEDFKSEYHRELFDYLGQTIQKLDEIIHEINEQASK